MKKLAVLFCVGLMSGLIADNIDYSVADWGAAEVRRAGDGTIFINYNYHYGDGAFLNTGAYGFTLYLWVERGGAITQFPTPAVPVEVRKLSGQDISHWFSVTPSSAVFNGYGSDPDTLGLPPNGLFVTTRVSFIVHPDSLTERITQVKIQANTAGIPNLGNGHGVIVRLIRDGANPKFDVSSWITDSNFVPIDTFLVTKRNCNCCRCRNCGNCRCGCSRSWVHPASFWYNVFVTNYETTLPDLVARINPFPSDFVAIPFNGNANYVWLVPVNVNSPDFTQAIPNAFNYSYGPVPIQPNATEFMAHHFKYDLGIAPAESLPRTYTFSATATAGGVTLYTDDILTGKLVTHNCNGCCRCGGGGGCGYDDGLGFVVSIKAGRTTQLRLSLPENGPVLVRTYGADGRLVQTTTRHLQSGTHEIELGRSLARGIYFCRVEAGTHRANLKFVKIR